MTNLVWKYADDPVTGELIEKVGKSLGVKFPQDYIECAKVNHGANVIPYRFYAKGIERAFGTLLSYDEECNDNLVEEYGNYRDTLPNDITPFEGAWEKEMLMEEEGLTEEQAEERARENVLYVAATFTEFLDKLHD